MLSKPDLQTRRAGDPLGSRDMLQALDRVFDHDAGEHIRHRVDVPVKLADSLLDGRVVRQIADRIGQKLAVSQTPVESGMIAGQVDVVTPTGQRLIESVIQLAVIQAAPQSISSSGVPGRRRPYSSYTTSPAKKIAGENRYIQSTPT